ncbi:zinc finger protein 407 [Pseudonaja textilis]|uniref:Zinc finger protein 407 n=1 Tax=Pseudonaja textilis TaxID=8673 RepID=A0A670XP84_PSETE|nr:zinc finger protein 407 [Pseudonaja textilis]
MNVEKSQNYECDENIKNELLQDSAKNILAGKTPNESFSNSKMLLMKELKNPLKNPEENGLAKRPFPQTTDQELNETTIIDNEPVSKRLKLVGTKLAKGNEGNPSESTTYEYSIDGTNKPVGKLATNTSPSRCSFSSNSSCIQQEFVPEDNTVHITPMENVSSQENETLLPKYKSSVLDDSTGITISTIKNVSKCSICKEIFSSALDLENHIQEQHLKQSKEKGNLYSTSKSEHTSSLQAHVKQTSGQLTYFCDLCGYQTFKEVLLEAHFLGKTHLRRQNLAARGGFVKILTKKSFYKKQRFPIRGKNVRKKLASNKQKIRDELSDPLRISSNKIENLKENCQDLAEMIPSTESTECITKEEASLWKVDGNGEKSDVSETSECNPCLLKPAKNSQVTANNLNVTGILSSFQKKRRILSQGMTFRQSTLFRLNQQIKRRYNLLGIGKKSKLDFRVKRSNQGELHQSDLSQAKVLQSEGNGKDFCVDIPKTAALHQVEKTILEHKTTSEKELDEQRTLDPGNRVGSTLSNKEDLKLDADKTQGEFKVHCQIYGYSSDSKDLECHQKNNHIDNSKINCPKCLFLAPNEISLGKHMSDEHSMAFSCSACCKYFLTEEEVAAHNATEHHSDLLSQGNSIRSLKSDLAVHSTSCPSGELPKVAESKAQQEDVKLSVLQPGSQFKESALSRSQFQCKKCFYKTRSSSVLTRHIKLRHAQEYHFLCKACNLYSLSKEGMEKHIKRSKHLENARKNNIGLQFEECIEKICVGGTDGKKGTEGPICGSLKTVLENESIHAPFSSLQKVSINKELYPSNEMIKDNELILGSLQKKGRPKGTISRTCPHCGLLASSVTNLTVHIRRKHSHQYSYLCKVCNYYTVTKGDMERHCATKKHKSRLEASGEKSVEFIVCPENDNIEAKVKKTDNPGNLSKELIVSNDQVSETDRPILENKVDEQNNIIQLSVKNIIHLPKIDSGRNFSETQRKIAESSNVRQDKNVQVQTRLATANDNKCAHCNFIAHSFSSLEVHIKRKHTKEFEYYCMACDYYAVTRREMIRHAATEKHKIKRQSYIASSGEEADIASIAKETAAVFGEEQQNTEDLQISLDETKSKSNIEEESPNNEVMQKANQSPTYLALEDSIASEVSKDCILEAVDAEMEDGTDQGRENTSREENDQDGGLKLNEMVELKETIDCVLHQHQEIAKSNIHLTTEPRDENMAFDESSPNSDLMKNENKLQEDSEKRYESSEVVTEEVKTDETHLSIVSDTGSALEQENISESTESFKNIHILQQQINTRQCPTAEEEGTLIDAQQETEVSLNNIWGSDSSVAEAMDKNDIALDALNSVDGKIVDGTGVQNSGQFDSSIVKISHEDGSEQVDRPVDGQNLSKQKSWDRAVKVDCPRNDGKKKKVEGHPVRESPRICCDDCGFLADGLSGLNVHIAMKHPSKEKHFHCLLCGKSFYTESSLHQHLASAGHMRNEQASVEELPEGGATFKCVKCTEPFDSEQNLFLHIKEQHEELLREVNKYIVEDTEQIVREREENKGNICKYCGKICRSSNSMAFLAHIRTHTGSKPFKCKICHFATAQLGDARNHVKRHLGMREYKCHVCGVAFVMKKHLNTHLLGKHGVGTPKERKFTCPLCNRSFTEKWAMNNHMKLHTGEKPYKCTWPTCHYSFLTASAMKDHYRTHTGEKSFLCDLCGFAGGTRHALTKHRRQHTGEKPFKCDECNFASTTQSHLTRHKRVHTGEKPYRCPWCDYRSNCAENIRKHILHTDKHEGVKMYNCPKCEYGTNIPVEFRNHLKELHPDIENPDLAYLHAGIVSKSYECRLKGQGATFVETTSPFTSSGLDEISPVSDKMLHGMRRHPQASEQVQQVIIIQGYDSDFTIDASVEETAAATLQTLAMAGQVARVVHITEDGQLIATNQNGSHVSSILPEQILNEQLSDGKTRLLVVEGSVGETALEDAVSIGMASAPNNAVVQQIMRQESLDTSTAHPPESASALDALLCAVTELGEVENKVELLDRAQLCHKEALQMSNPEADTISMDDITQETQVFHGVQEIEEEQSMEVVTQVVHPSTIISSQENAQVAFKKMVEGVLQFAVCDTAAADQLMKEGVTQVILNEEGTVHMVSREGSQIIMQEADSHTLSIQSQHMDLVEADGEISQIIVTEEIAQAMVRESNNNFANGATHYIVTQLPQEIENDSRVYSHTVIEKEETQDLLQAGTVINSNQNSCDGSVEQLSSMLIYTEDGSQTAIIQGQRDNSEL